MGSRAGVGRQRREEKEEGELTSSSEGGESEGGRSGGASSSAALDAGMIQELGSRLVELMDQLKREREERREAVKTLQHQLTTGR